MIITADGWAAIYRRTVQRPDGSDHSYLESRPLVAWQENRDGDLVGLVAPDEGDVIPAHELGGFRGYERDGETVVSVVPAHGVQCIYKGDDGEQWLVPLTLWGLRADGSVIPLDADGNGTFENPTTTVGFVGLTFEP